jgi:curli biogenesis system outer membrane secretion channel CsgG
MLFSAGSFVSETVPQEPTMFRTLSSATRLAALAAALALPAALAAQDNRPVVVVFTFGNSSIGTGHAEFDGIATGVQDLLITDMASNSKIRLVDRASIDAVLREQNMVKAGQIDPATAVRLGRIMGAQYAVIGGFMSDGRGSAVLTGRTVDIETTQIANPEKITGKSDDVLGMIGQLSSRLGANMKLDPKPGRRVGDAGGASDAAPKSAPAQSGAPAAASKAAPAETYAKPVSHPISKTKLDIATMKIYSNALDEMDRKNSAKAAALLKQVLAKFPDFEPAQRNLEKLPGKVSN